MRSLSTLAALLLSSQVLLGCSDDSSDGPSASDDVGADPATSDPLIDPNLGAGPGTAICAIPPDFQVGDATTYRYTDETGATMDISLDVASSDGSAIVFDVTEGDSVYRAAVSTFCNDTPELDLPDGDVSASLQELIDQYASRPLLREIVQPGFGRFDDGLGLDPEAEVVDECAEGDASVPPPDGPQQPAFSCTFTYEPDVPGSTVTVRTTVAQSRREIIDYNRLVEKRQTAADGSTRSLVLVSFEPAGS